MHDEDRDRAPDGRLPGGQPGRAARALFRFPRPDVAEFFSLGTSRMREQSWVRLLLRARRAQPAGRRLDPRDRGRGRRRAGARTARRAIDGRARGARRDPERSRPSRSSWTSELMADTSSRRSAGIQARLGSRRRSTRVIAVRRRRRRPRRSRSWCRSTSRSSTSRSSSPQFADDPELARRTSSTCSTRREQEDELLELRGRPLPDLPASRSASRCWSATPASPGANNAGAASRAAGCCCC